MDTRRLTGLSSTTSTEAGRGGEPATSPRSPSAESLPPGSRLCSAILRENSRADLGRIALGHARRRCRRHGPPDVTPGRDMDVSSSSPVGEVRLSLYRFRPARSHPSPACDSRGWPGGTAPAAAAAGIPAKGRASTVEAGARPPCLEVLFQDDPIGLVVIDDKTREHPRAHAERRPTYPVRRLPSPAAG